MTATTNSVSRGTKTQVLIVDDHAMICRGVSDLVNAEHDMEICGEARTMQEAMALAAKVKPDLMIVDVSLHGNNGIELMKNLVSRWPSVPILAYSMHDESIYAERSLRAGAMGYVMKQSSPETLLAAMRQILKGKIFLSEAMSEKLLGRMVRAGATTEITASPIDKLSDRELEVLELLGRGMRTSEIADKLCLSIKTIETYREHLKQKLSLSSGQELLRYAIEWSLNGSGNQ